MRSRKNRTGRDATGGEREAELLVVTLGRSQLGTDETPAQAGAGTGTLFRLEQRHLLGKTPGVHVLWTSRRLALPPPTLTMEGPSLSAAPTTGHPPACSLEQINTE